MSELLAIARERIYSPGKVRADRAILAAVAARLQATYRVRLMHLDGDQRTARSGAPCLSRSATTTAARPPFTVVLAMCQGPAALAMLRRWESDGVRIINAPGAIAGCHRVAMIRAFQRAGVPHPESVLIATDAPGALPDWTTSSVWVKRGDVHAMRASDVVRVRGRAAILECLSRFRRRGITTALLQRHVPGRVLKFYGVAGGFFACFTTGARRRDCSASAAAAIRPLAEAGGAAVGLEVFGGDVVWPVDGPPLLIDLNDWPSYAPCRFAAADAIGAYVNAQLEPNVEQ